MKINEYFFTEKFVQSHVGKIAQQPPSHVYRLTFLTAEFARALARPRILDVGCGAAQAQEYFHEVFPSFEYLGLDFSPKMVEEARRRYPGSRLARFTFDRSLPIRDSAVDLVFARDFFEHVEHPCDLLDECLRVTRRHVLFTFRCSKLPDDMLLFKFAENVRFNLLSLDRFLAHLRGRDGDGLNVELCVVLNQPYYPSVYVCPDNPDWVRDLDRAGAKKVHALIEKTRTGRVEIFDRTAEWEHRGFLTKLPPWLALAKALRARLVVSAWGSRLARVKGLLTRLPRREL